MDASGLDPRTQLATAAAGAKKIPLTRDVRFDPGEILRILDELSAAAAQSAARDSIEEFAEAVRRAKPVSLSDQVRMNRDEFRRLVDKVQLETA